MLTVQRACKRAWDKSIDDLDRPSDPRVFHHVQHTAFDYEVLKVQFNQLINGNVRNEACVTILFWIGAIQAVFVLHVDHGTRAKHLAHQVSAGVSAVRRNASDWWIGVPERIRWHAEKHHRAPFGEVERQLRKLCWLDERHTVLGQQVVNHSSVLHADKRSQHAEDAGRHAEVEPHAIRMPSTGPGARPDDELVALQVRDQLVDQRKYRGSATVDETLAADF